MITTNVIMLKPHKGSETVVAASLIERAVCHTQRIGDSHSSLTYRESSMSHTKDRRQS